MILYTANLTNVRFAAGARPSGHRLRLWLVDVDDLPGSRLVSFRAADHLGAPNRSIRTNLTAWLAEQGVASPARIRMLTAPRSFGYVFNPLTVYWCEDAAGAPLCVVAEVTGTRGEQRCHLLLPDQWWWVEADPVSGRHRVRLPPPDERLSFATVLTGRRVGPATPLRVLGYALSLLPQRVRGLLQAGLTTPRAGWWRTGLRSRG